MALGLMPLPAVQPLTVQLKNSEGVCWEATYGPPARQNSSSRFTDHAD